MHAPHYKGPTPSLCNAHARPPPRHSTLILPFCHFCGPCVLPRSRRHLPTTVSPSPSHLIHLISSCVYLAYHLVYCLPVALILIYSPQISFTNKFAQYSHRTSHTILPLLLLFSLIPLPPPGGKYPPVFFFSFLFLRFPLSPSNGGIYPNIDTWIMIHNVHLCVKRNHPKNT